MNKINTLEKLGEILKSIETEPHLYYSRPLLEYTIFDGQDTISDDNLIDLIDEKYKLLKHE